MQIVHSCLFIAGRSSLLSHHRGPPAHRKHSVDRGVELCGHLLDLGAVGALVLHDGWQVDGFLGCQGPQREDLAGASALSVRADQLGVLAGIDVAVREEQVRRVGPRLRSKTQLGSTGCHDSWNQHAVR